MFHLSNFEVPHDVRNWTPASGTDPIQLGPFGDLGRNLTETVDRHVVEHFASGIEAVQQMMHRFADHIEEAHQPATGASMSLQESDSTNGARS